MNQQAPVGTTLALLERSMKVMAAVQSRLHASMKREFKILAEIVRDHAPHEYPYDLAGNESMKLEDFDDRIDVIPVSDPNSATMAQRIMQYQAALQLAGTAPQMYDLPKLHRQMLEVLGIQDADKIIPSDNDIPARDPVTENMDILNGNPVKAYLWQDHEAHIQVHMSAQQDPKVQEMMQQSPTAPAVLGAGVAHVTEHLAFQYRKDIEAQMGVQLPPPNEPLPEDVEVQLSKLVAEASARLLQKNISEADQERAQKEAEDPILQMRREELEIRKQETQAKIVEAAERLRLDQEKAVERNAVERERIETQERIAGAKIGAEVALESAKAKAEGEEIESRERMEGAKLGVKVSEMLMGEEDRDSKERIEGAKIGAKIAEKVGRDAERLADE